jgi:hypothetical protein
MTENTQFHKALVQDAVARVVAVVGLLGIALIHLLDVIGKFAETPYLAWMYIGAILSAVALAGWLIVKGSSRAAWAATGGLAAAILAGFVLSRTTGLPSATGDIGNWSEGLGLASMFVETGLLALSGWALAALPFPRREVHPGVARSLESERIPAGAERIPAGAERIPA